MRLAVDARLLSGRSGAATYARAVHRAQRQIGNAVQIADEPGIGSLDRALRWLRACIPLATRLDARDDGQTLFAEDIFRRAQVWFDVHGRLMPLRVTGPPGLIHWTYPVPLHVPGWINVYTVHDAIPLTAPELSPIRTKRHLRLLQRIAAEASSSGAIVTISESARQEIARALSLPIEGITVCGIGVERSGGQLPLPQDLISRTYILACGSLEPRKNPRRLIEAYRKSKLTMPLVLAGPRGPDEQDYAPLLDCPGVLRLSDVSNELMTTLIAQASVVVMPSLAEGFGLPIIEAMQLGTPVICSDLPATTEVAGGAALLVDPLDTKSIADALCTLAANPALHAKLVGLGLTNARRFTPDIFADRLRDLYEKLIA